MPYGYGRQDPIIPLSLNDLNMSANLFIISATMAVKQADSTRHDEENSPHSPEPSDPSPISTPPMNLSTSEGWETPHTTTQNATFYPKDERQRIY